MEVLVGQVGVEVAGQIDDEAGLAPSLTIMCRRCTPNGVGWLAGKGTMAPKAVYSAMRWRTTSAWESTVGVLA